MSALYSFDDIPELVKSVETDYVKPVTEKIMKMMGHEAYSQP